MAQVKQVTYTYAEDMTDERQQQVLQLSKEAFEISHSTEFRGNVRKHIYSSRSVQLTLFLVVGDSQYTTIARTIRSKMDQIHGR